MCQEEIWLHPACMRVTTGCRELQAGTTTICNLPHGNSRGDTPLDPKNLSKIRAAMSYTMEECG